MEHLPSGLERPRHRRAWLAAAACAIVVVLVLQARLVGDWRVDDAYITFSFSKNLARGRGPIFGYDLRVEGYSNFLWMAALAAPLALFQNLDPILPARIGAYASLLLLVLVTWGLVRRRNPSWWGALSCLALASSTDVTRAALSGLETVPHAALLGLCVLLYTHRDPRVRRWTWTAALGACLVRIDGFVLVGVLAAWDVALAPKGRRLIASKDWPWFLVPAAAYLAYFAARWAWYGLPLPLPYYAKSMVTTGDPFRGVRYLWYCVSSMGLWVLVPGAAAAVACAPRSEALLLGLLILVQSAYAAAVGGDWMPFARMMIPALPLFLALFAWGGRETLDLLARRLAGGRARRGRGWIVAAHALPVAVIVVLAVHLDAHFVTSRVEAMKEAYAEEQKRHFLDDLLANRRLFALLPRAAGDRIATDYGGIFAYYTDARIIEMWGLANREIALRGTTEGINPIFGKTCIPCYRDFEPDYFHVMCPLARPLDAFSSHPEVIDEVFQGPALDRMLNLRDRYVTGRVIDEKRQLALWFLERIRPGVTFETRHPAPGATIDYPFLGGLE